jgi:DNA-binding Lrp family transcriptional regulator
VGIIVLVIVVNSSDIDYKLISKLTMDGRVSLLELSRSTGLSYTAVRNRLKRLIENGYLDIKPLVSAKLAGVTAAIVKIKSSRPHKLVEKLMNCNKVIGAMYNGDGVIALLYSSGKKELAFTLDRIISECSSISEYSIEYGRLPPNAKIIIRNPLPDCQNCIYYKLGLCSGCLPILRARGNR